jgi:hypothetical protein
LDAVASLSARLDRGNNSQKVEMQKIRTEVRGEIDSSRSKVVNQSRQINAKMDSKFDKMNFKFDQIDTKMNSKFDQMMAAILAMSEVAALITAAPALTTVPLRSAPAQQQIQQQQQKQQQKMQQTQLVLDTPASPLPAPSASASASLLPTSLIPASTVVSVVASVVEPIPTKVKDNFKPMPRDKQTQNAFDFARQFYKATKDKPLDRIEDALMNLESNDSELYDLLKVSTATGPSAHLSETPEEWSKYLTCRNLGSLFLKPTAHIQDVKNQILKE